MWFLAIGGDAIDEDDVTVADVLTFSLRTLARIGDKSPTRLHGLNFSSFLNDSFHKIADTMHDPFAELAHSPPINVTDEKIYR